MLEAFVFVWVEPNIFDEVVKKLKEIDEIKEIYEVTGDLDLILKITANGYTQAASVVKEKIMKIPGIKKTTTIVVVKRHK